MNCSAQGTLRVGEIGDVARPLGEDEVRRCQPLAARVAESALPRLVLAELVVSALRAGRCPERGRVASRTVGPIVDALVVLMALDARECASRRRLHETVRALELPALDALEDLLARFESVHPIVEAERMYRADLLDGDWRLVLGGAAPAGRIAARVVVTVRRSAEA